MKKLFLVLILLLSNKLLDSRDPGYPNERSLPKKEDNKYYILDSHFLKYLDGVANAMDGDAIAEVLQVRKMILDIKAGKLMKIDESGNPILDAKGNQIIEEMTYQDQKKTISELCNIEHQLLKKYDSDKDVAVKGALIGQLNELKSTLKDVKHYFIRSTKKFITRIEPAKQFVLKLMEDSCKKRKIARTDTVMLDWANTKGNEEAVFNDRIKNLADFSKFLTQVYNFLGDLTRSCKIGFAQYIQDKKNNKK